MAVCVVGFAFEGSITNGGEAIKVGLWRCQRIDAAQRVWYADHGCSIKPPQAERIVVRNRGDPMFKDCEVAGVGNSKQFCLKTLYTEEVFPHIKKNFVGPGKRYEGYQVVYQEDNAGAHCNELYTDAIKGMCKEYGWKLERQSPQSPQFNVLDLAVFPALSRRHSYFLCRKSANPSGNDIWEAADSVFRNMESSVIARAFILSWHMCKSAVKSRGDNSYMEGDLHFGIRFNYVNTPRGVRRRHKGDVYEGRIF